MVRAGCRVSISFSARLLLIGSLVLPAFTELAESQDIRHSASSTPSRLLDATSGSLSRRPDGRRSCLRKPYDWPMSTPAEHGLDSELLNSAYDRAAEYGFMYSLLLVKDGYLISEQYFNQQTITSANNLWSTSKCYLSTLVGIALRESYLGSIDQGMMDFFPEYASDNLDQRKYDITIRHLLTMRAGIPGEFDYVPGYEFVFNEFLHSGNMIAFSINLPLIADPGDEYHYSTMSTHILAAIIARSTGMTASAFAEEFLFDPINISIRGWDEDDQGNHTGGWGMYFTPRDMARYGYLYLRNGFLDGEQIIPVEWINESLQRHSGHPYWNHYNIVLGYGFGYQWDIGRMDGHDVYYRLGRGGQLIFNIPDLDMIIVTTAKGDLYIIDDATVDDQCEKCFRLIKDHILPSVLDPN